MPAKATNVFYIPGRFAHERLEDHEVESAAEAKRLVATGAFALSEKEASAAAFTTPEATPATDANVKKAPAEPAAGEPAPQPEPEPADESAADESEAVTDAPE